MPASHQRSTTRTAAVNMSIDLQSYEPAYVQLANILRHQIAAGIYRPGDRLPSETELCQRFELSRMTVRRVINMLSAEGTVRTSQGRGTFVRSWGLGAAVFQLKQLQDLLSDQDRATVKLLEVRVLRADDKVARKLSISCGQKVIYIRRLLYVKNEPIIYHREYLVYDPERPIVEAEMGATSLRAFFDGSDAVGLKRGDLSIEVAILDEDERGLLCSPVLGAFNLEHVFYDFDDRPTSWGWFLCRSDRVRFATTVGTPDQP